MPTPGKTDRTDLPHSLIREQTSSDSLLRLRTNCRLLSPHPLRPRVPIKGIGEALLPSAAKPPEELARSCCTEASSLHSEQTAGLSKRQGPKPIHTVLSFYKDIFPYFPPQASKPHLSIGRGPHFPRLSLLLCESGILLNKEAVGDWRGGGGGGGCRGEPLTRSAPLSTQGCPGAPQEDLNTLF